MLAAVATLLVLAAALCAGNPGAVKAVLSQWADPYGALSHGYLLLAAATGLSIQALRAPEMASLPRRPSWQALPLLVLLVGAALLAELLFIGDVRTLLLPLLLGTASALVLGMPVARRLSLPLAFLWLGLPVWNALTLPLQSLTTAAAEALVALSGVPAYVEGNFVYLPDGTFEIATGCAGLNYLLASLTLGAAACARLVDGWRRRLVVMVVAAGSGLVANWVRVASLVVIGHVTQMQHYLIRVDHLAYGWMVFAAAMLPLFWLSWRWRGVESLPARAPEAAFSPPARIARAAALFVACTLLLSPLLVQPPPVNEPAVAPEAPFRFPSGWRPQTDAHVERAYRRGATAGAEAFVEVYVAGYPVQSSGSRLSNPGNDLAAGPWRVIGTRAVEVPGPPRHVLAFRLAGNAGQHLLHVWYVAAGRTAHSKATLRLAEVRGLLEGRRDGAAVAVLTPCVPDCESAARRLEAMLPALGDVRDGPSADAVLARLGFDPA